MSFSGFWFRAYLNGSHFLKKLGTYVPVFRTIRSLRDEVNLLNSYSSDTVYTLRYETMRYDYMSPAVSKLIGYSIEELRSIPFRSLILKTNIITDRIEPVISYDDLEHVRQTGDVNRWQADYLVRTKDGRSIWLTDISYPWRDKKGKVIGSVGSLRDITARKQAEEQTKEEMARLAYSDHLTSLANRRYFFNQINDELKRIKRNNNHFSVLMIDVDGLKIINDTYSCHIGDRVLCDIAKIITDCIRETDTAARIGGGEYGIFLPDTSQEGAYWVGEHICLEVAKYRFLDHELDQAIRVTVSIGVASTEENRNISSAQLYKKADTRLYIAKHTGRNQVSKDEIVSVH